MVVCGRLDVLSCHPVVGLPDTFSPLRWRISVRLGTGLAFVFLHDDGVEVRDHLSFDAGDSAADTAHGDQVGLGVGRFGEG